MTTTNPNPEATMSEQIERKIDWSKPLLRKQSADGREPEAIRNATPEEIEASRAAEPDGYIEVEGIGTCYVEE